jgi:hypothetical protein
MEDEHAPAFPSAGTEFEGKTRPTVREFLESSALREKLAHAALNTPSRINAEKLSEVFRSQVLDLLRPDAATIPINYNQIWYVSGLLVQAFSNRLISIGPLSPADFASRYPKHASEMTDVLVAATYLNSLIP